MQGANDVPKENSIIKKSIQKLKLSLNILDTQCQGHSTNRGLTSVPSFLIVLNSSRCLLYTSDAADDMQCVDLGGRRIIKKKSFSVGA